MLDMISQYHSYHMMNKSITTLATLIAAAPCYGVEYPTLSPDQTALQQEQLLLDVMDAQGLTELQLSKPSQEDMRKLQTVMKTFLQLEHLHDELAGKITAQYFGLSILLAESPEDMDILQSELQILASKHPSVNELWESNLKEHFAKGSKAFFEDTQGMRSELARQLTKQEPSPDKLEKLRKEADEIKDAIVANRAVVSVTNPTQEECIRRRDTLAPFLARKDLEPETVQDLMKNYIQCAMLVDKREQDRQNSKKRLEVLAENYPQKRDYILSLIQYLYNTPQ